MLLVWVWTFIVQRIAHLNRWPIAFEGFLLPVCFFNVSKLCLTLPLSPPGHYVTTLHDWNSQSFFLFDDLNVVTVRPLTQYAAMQRSCFSYMLFYEAVWSPDTGVRLSSPIVFYSCSP